MKAIGIVCLIGATRVLAVAQQNSPIPRYEADFSVTSKNVKVVNYESRTPPAYGQSAGCPVLSFRYRPNGKSRDTMWGVETVPFEVTPGDEYIVLIEMEGDIPSGYGSPGAHIGWIGADGRRLESQDAKGRKTMLEERLMTPFRRKQRVASRAYSRGLVPLGARKAVLSYKIDRPDLGKKAEVSFRRIAYYEHPLGEPHAFDDITAPVLKILTPSPCGDLMAPIRFQVTDSSGVNWDECAITFDGTPLDIANVKRDGDVFVIEPNGGWARDSVHRIEIEALDTRGNFGVDCGFVAFTAKTPRHPKCTVRDDGMILVDGKPFFPLGWCRVRPCSGNDYSISKGVSEMRANGMNYAHTYLVRGLESPQEDELYDELVAACAKEWVAFHAEPADRKPHTSRFFDLCAENLFRGLDYTAPLFWGIGDDTSMFYSPNDLKFCYRFCKAIDPGVLTVSADVALGPGGHTPYAPYADVLLLESYPITAETPADNEMAMAALNLDNAWAATRAAKVEGRTVIACPQTFKGWENWKRLPTAEEVRCQAYLAIVGRARGLVYYASCGDPGHLNRKPKDGKIRTPKNLGPLNVPHLKEQFFSIMREIASLMPSLVARDARQQPHVTITEGPVANVLGGPSVRCLLKEDGLLMAVNTAHLPVTAEIALPNGKKFSHVFPRNGVGVTKIPMGL